MEKRNQSQDQQLVRECLSGSETAWQDFYARFIGLMRSVVKKHTAFTAQDTEDVTQAAFMELTQALRTYDLQQSLPRYVCVITERVLIDEFRKRTAAKRAAETDHEANLDVHSDGASGFAAQVPSQDEALERAQTALQVRRALDGLDPGCREVIRLRYFEDLPFSEIAAIVGGSENTVTVRTRRCLEKLRARLQNGERRGVY